MTSYKQIEANRRNALKSTRPKTETGKLASRRNAVRHGLTAETVIGALEDAEDYKAFESAIAADYDASSAVERELVLRLVHEVRRSPFVMIHEHMPRACTSDHHLLPHITLTLGYGFRCHHSYEKVYQGRQEDSRASGCAVMRIPRKFYSDPDFHFPFSKTRWAYLVYCISPCTAIG